MNPNSTPRGLLQEAQTQGRTEEHGSSKRKTGKNTKLSELLGEREEPRVKEERLKGEARL